MRQIIPLTVVLLVLLFLMPLVLGGGVLAEGPPPSPSPSPAPTPSPAPSPEVSPPPVTPSGESLDAALTIRVLVGSEVLTLTMDDYLFCVVAAEMPASFPLEALRAQAVAARTYAEAKMLDAAKNGPPEVHKGADVCDQYTHCKAYISREQAMGNWGERAEEYAATIAGAVASTDGEVILYEQEPIVAVFHAASSGRTERAADVWGGDLPYLQSVESPGEDACAKYHGRAEIPLAEFKKTIADAYPQADLQTVPLWGESERSAAGGVISVTVGGVPLTGGRIRTLFALQSAHFTMTLEDDRVVFETLGYGHGVGMSQYGARALALEGKTYEEILRWYYTGVTVSRYEITGNG